jgi:hypothetical protein
VGERRPARREGTAAQRQGDGGVRTMEASSGFGPTRSERRRGSDFGPALSGQAREANGPRRTAGAGRRWL